MNENRSFEEPYLYYLTRLENLSFETAPAVPGITYTGSDLNVPFFGRRYAVSARGIRDAEGTRPDFDICVILCRYLLMCSISPADREEWRSFRDLKDSGPLTVYFAHEVESAVAARFTGQKQALARAAAALGGRDTDIRADYDIASEIEALPNLPVCLLFNDADEEFGAVCKVLFRPDVENRLDAETIAILGRRLFMHLAVEGGKEQRVPKET
ncbi:MAG: DUF3786 domain-containing protein [Desulfarculaceae bacterium]|nr:DUF3786 domain-containing protein [Desulfarculaceae bacterium]